MANTISNIQAARREFQGKSTKSKSKSLRQTRSAPEDKETMERMSEAGKKKKGERKKRRGRTTMIMIK